MPFATAADGTAIHYDLAGPADGEPVLMIQGLGADSRAWVFQRRALAKHFRVILMDNRGVGRSDRTTDIDLVTMADDGAAVLDHAGYPSAHVIGASMGGIVAQLMAVAHSERVRSLVLCCTACRHEPWRRELLEEWAEIATTQGMRAVLGRAMRWLIGPRVRRRFGRTIGLLGHLIMACPSETFAAQIRAILAMDDAIVADAPPIGVPVLIVVGSQDILTPAADSEELLDRYPHAEADVVVGAAHGFMVEQPNELNRLVLGFLERNADAQPQPVEVPDALSPAGPLSA